MSSDKCIVCSQPTDYVIVSRHRVNGRLVPVCSDAHMREWMKDNPEPTSRRYFKRTPAQEPSE